MEPVVGVDVAKGASVIQAFLKRNEPFGKLESITHTDFGFERLGEIIAELKAKTGTDPAIVLKVTGDYHRGLVAYLDRSGWKYFIINPLQSKRAKGTQLRKVKTDAADAWHLAEMYYCGDVRPHRTWEENYTELQHVTRQHEFITGMFVQAKLNTRALLEQVFPGYIGLFHHLFSATSLRVLQRCLEGRVDGLIDMIKENTRKSHSKQWIEEKAAQLEQMLFHWHNQPRSQSQTRALLSMLSLLLEFLEQLNRLENRLRK
ncbi:IS110 family transposase [Paenibacillus periandrae]|uniref:IS110 family transposase n=1 Tax=Paenibacillus periandrae TaxID=1761741 RepID=UPI001F08DBFF|nr:IS110 family transposase [Paenibacillus periandrae]